MKERKQRRIEIAHYIDQYKSSRGCSICNENHPACLDFHHVDPLLKEHTVSKMVSSGKYSLERILEEVDKCIILCSNCHRKHHHSN